MAAHSALDLFGFNHYVPMGKPLLMVAYHNSNIPEWMTSDSFDKNLKSLSTKMIDVPQTSTVQIEGVLNRLCLATVSNSIVMSPATAPKHRNYGNMFLIQRLVFRPIFTSSKT